MQALYTWYQSDDKNLNRSVESIFLGIERTYDLYLKLLQLMVELADAEERYYKDLLPKHLPSGELVLQHFNTNTFISFLRTDKVFQSLLKEHKISWQKETDLVKRLFSLMKQTPEYKAYVASPSQNFTEDVEFCTFVFKQVVMPSEAFQNTMEDENLWWAEAIHFVNSVVLKTIKATHPSRKGVFEIMHLYKDREDDREFMKKLFTETINNDSYFEELITAKTKNWELERIALVDVILMKMALTEVIYFQNIPVKVSINEYIDISKDYSTPKSKIFINGVIDKLVADLQLTGKVKKTGRGLLE
jgi:transcription antitermination protein NusB